MVVYSPGDLKDWLSTVGVIFKKIWWIGIGLVILLMSYQLKRNSDTVIIEDYELEIVQGLKNDSTVQQIAQNLNIKVKTMEARVSKLKAKTDSKTLHGLLWLFHKNGLLKDK